MASYTEKEKSLALIRLRENAYQYELTSRQLDIPSATLKNWVLKYGKDIEREVQESRHEIISATAEEMERKKQKFFSDVFDAKELILEKIVDRVRGGKETLFNLTVAFEKISKMELESIKLQFEINKGGVSPLDDTDTPEVQQFIDNVVFQQITVAYDNGIVKKINSLQELKAHESN